MERYGVEHPMQNAELSEKMLIKSKKYKKYILPSGKETYIQGGFKESKSITWFQNYCALLRYYSTLTFMSLTILFNLLL